MLTIYTAIGQLRIRQNHEKQPYPVVINQGKEHALDCQEMFLWSSLAFQILTLEEARHLYELKTQVLTPVPKHGFGHYLRRLLFRGLIAKGEGLTGVDALYELLGNLYIVPLADSFHVRLFSSLHLLLKGVITMGDLKQHLNASKESPAEKSILRLAKATAMSTAELLQCMEYGKTEIRNADDLMDALYTDDDTTYESIKDQVHNLHVQTPMLSAIGNLYLKKRISFMTL